MDPSGRELATLYFRAIPPFDDSALRALAGEGNWSCEASESEERIFFDTFDWRLLAAGLAAEQRSIGDGTCFQVRKFGRAVPLASQPGPAPRLAIDAAQRPCNARLVPLVEMRALLPRVLASIRRNGWALRNADEKIVVRLFQEILACRDPDRKGPTGHLQLTRLEPLKGYPNSFAEVRAKLEALAGRAPERNDLCRLALQAAGVVPQPPPKKPVVHLTPGLPSRTALAAILLQQLEAMEANLEGTRADLDSEFLHDFRVAVRRTRSALGQLKKVFPAEVLRHYRREFAWLGEITGPTRDLDVYLLGFPRYRAALPPDRQADIEPLHDFLQHRQRREQRLLARRLAGRRYRKLVESWRDWLEQAGDDDPAGPLAEQPVLAVASRRIWKIFNRVVREGEAIGPDSPDADLHELRKSCKKLRYLLEFFASLYPGKPHRQLVKALKGLQENLGTFQDLSVQTAALRNFSLQMTAEGEVPPATLLAMGMLIEQLRQHQQEVRREFRDRFEAFASPETRGRFSELYAAGDNAKES